VTARALLAAGSKRNDSPARRSARKEFTRRLLEDPAGLAAEIAALIPEGARGVAYRWTQGNLFDRRIA
jgi:hypothetical protein